MCKELGVPIAQEKTEGPPSSLVYLGYLLDTIKSQIKIPGEKKTSFAACMLKKPHHRIRLTQGIEEDLRMWQSKRISNDQELIQSDPTSCPQNQKGNN